MQANRLQWVAWIGRAAVGLVAAILAPATVPSGVSAAWTPNGVPACRAENDQTSVVLTPTPSGGVIAGWLDTRTGYNTDVWAQRLDAAGNRTQGWYEDGVFATFYGENKYDLVSLPDGAGGAWYAWSDRENLFSPTRLDIKVQRLAASGQPAPGWPTDGLLVCGADFDQRRPQLVSDGAGGVIVTWEDRRGSTADVYAVRVLPNATIGSGWPTNGRVICSAAGNQLSPVISPDGSGGAFVVWRDLRSGEADLYGARVTGSGVLLGWGINGLGVCLAPGNQGNPVIVRDGGSGLVIAWVDARAGNSDVYALRLTSSGSRPAGWNANGNPVCTQPTDQLGVRAIPDGVGGVILVWDDLRNEQLDSDVYAQRLDSSGRSSWTADGVAVTQLALDQSGAVLASDGYNGAYVAWRHRSSEASQDFDVRAQRLRADGTPGWDPAGVALRDADGLVDGITIVGDGAGGAFVGWSDQRDAIESGRDVYVTRIGSDTPEPGRATGLAGQHRNGQTFLTWTAPPGIGWTWRVYASDLPILTEADLEQAELLGAVGDSTWWNRRLSVFLQQTHGYRTDSTEAPLDSTRGLFVTTPSTDGVRHFAVTGQIVGHPENRALVAGDNTLLDSIDEGLDVPRPVHQGGFVVGGVPIEIYTLWTGRDELPRFPAMANRASQPYNCAIARGSLTPDAPLMVRPHASGGHFLQAIASTGLPGEWRLALDDQLPNGASTFWFGYHEDLDITAPVTAIPEGGRVVDYTLRRLDHTVAWALTNFPVDRGRVYAQGFSAAAVACVFMALQRPETFAAVLPLVGKYDFSKLDDPNPLCSFNPGGALRVVSDRLWGPVDANLPCGDGLPVFDRLNARLLVGLDPTTTLPPIVSFNGRNDDLMGWKEKIEYFDALQQARQHGWFYWDSRDHLGSSNAAWSPLQTTQELARFRSDRSFPALTRASADDDPGDGTLASGDSVGALNAYLDWVPEVVDAGDAWQVQLFLRNLPTRTSARVAPDSLRVDVTPRRLQQFVVAPGATYTWRLERVGDDALLDSGEAVADSFGLVTVPQVLVLKTGSRLRIAPMVQAAVGPRAGVGAPGLALARNPVTRPTDLSVAWPRSGEAHVELFDASGRRVRILHRGAVEPGLQTLLLDPASLPRGVYFVRARLGDARVSRRVVLLR